ncbi:molybdenum cofactor guanylyltransferase [Dyadobacter luteus]|jgi:molybdopterin-guanine dinucleotide biosynthesis protein A|uniref:Probable molybdenum cofactor guanylyltransferase n=1 Tax=Dyadobacter luteus TaxID=2259619 RepID=A0A3D8Y4X7_9BACT|nr:molybdenum cofactor guanylyltransferase [Dyadobacter luteus]REA57509.1 molybdenum cofactor guanylyltransferase [Dyadobacter luteus]
MKTESHLYGLVVGGGESQRMGKDKAFLTYYEKPQCFHLTDLLKNEPALCEQVFISCNEKQQHLIPAAYQPLPDKTAYKSNGPIASLLTAFEKYPGNDFLIVGCDYPLLSIRELRSFLNTIRRESIAATFYNNENKYEPLIGWYSAQCAPLLMQFYREGNRSLQHFLRQNNAEKYVPEQLETMKSADTPEDYERILSILQKRF